MGTISTVIAPDYKISNTEYNKRDSNYQTRLTHLMGTISTTDQLEHNVPNISTTIN